MVVLPRGMSGSSENQVPFPMVTFFTASGLPFKADCCYTFMDLPQRKTLATHAKHPEESGWDVQDCVETNDRQDRSNGIDLEKYGQPKLVGCMKAPNRSGRWDHPSYSNEAQKNEGGEEWEGQPESLQHRPGT